MDGLAGVASGAAAHGGPGRGARGAAAAAAEVVGVTHWSSRLLARRLGVRATAVLDVGGISASGTGGTEESAATDC